MTFSSPVSNEELLICLQNTLSPDQASRTAAEKRLEQLALVPNFPSHLLSLVMSVDGPAQQSGSVYLKNLVDKKWEELEESERSKLKECLVPAMIRCGQNVSVHKQLRECVHEIIRTDFPNKWPQLIGQIESALAIENSLLTGLIVLYEVASWKGYDNDQFTEELHAKLAPTLLHLGESGYKLGTEEGYLITRWVFKIFRASIMFRFSYPLLGHFGAWNSLFSSIIALPVPSQYSASSEDDDVNEEMESTNFWKMKNWAMMCQNRVFSRYANNPKYADDQVKSFSKEYMAHLAIGVFELNLRVVESVISHSLVLTDSVFIELLGYLEDAVKCNDLWKKAGLSNHIMQIIKLFAFPRVCFNSEDEEAWLEDPVEFVRANMDPYEEYETLSTVALGFITSCVRARTKTVFPLLLSFISDILQKPFSPDSFEQKEGGLKVLGSLVSQIKKDDSLKSQVDNLIMHLILPLLKQQGQVPGFLKMRAAWTLQQLSLEINLNSSVAMEAFSLLTASILPGNDLPVRVQSALTAGSLLDVEAVQQAINGSPAIPKLTEAALDLTNQVEIEALSALVEKLVTMFSQDLAPYAAQLCQQLAGTFTRMLEGIQPTENDDGKQTLEFDSTDKMMSAIGLIRALTTLVDAMSANTQIILSLVPILTPLVLIIWKNRVVDVYDEAFEMMCQLTFNLKQIPTDMWSVFEVLFQVYADTGAEYLSDVCSVLDNFITYGSSVIVANASYLQSILTLADGVFSTSEDTFYDEINSIALVLESLFLNCQGLPVDYSSIISLLNTRMQKELEEGNSITVIRLIEAYLAMLISKPHVLASLPPVFWNQLIAREKNFTRVHDKKLIIAALTPILAHLTQPEVVSLYLNAINTLPEALKKRQEMLDQSDDDESDYDDYYNNDSDYESMESENEEAQPSRVSNEQKLSSSDEDDDDSSYDWDDSEDDEILEEDLTSETPLDKLDVAALVKGNIRSLNPQVVPHLTTDLQQFLKSLL